MRQTERHKKTDKQTAGQETDWILPKGESNPSHDVRAVELTYNFANAEHPQTNVLFQKKNLSAIKTREREKKRDKNWKEKKENTILQQWKKREQKSIANSFLNPFSIGSESTQKRRALATALLSYKVTPLPIIIRSDYTYLTTFSLQPIIPIFSPFPSSLILISLLSSPPRF